MCEIIFRKILLPLYTFETQVWVPLCCAQTTFIVSQTRRCHHRNGNPYSGISPSLVEKHVIRLGCTFVASRCLVSPAGDHISVSVVASLWCRPREQDESTLNYLTGFELMTSVFEASGSRVLDAVVWLCFACILIYTLGWIFIEWKE